MPDIHEALPQLCWLVGCAALVDGLAERNMAHRWYYRANYMALLVFALVAVHFRRPGALLAVLALLLGGSCLSDPLARKYRCAAADSRAIPDLHGASNADRRVC